MNARRVSWCAALLALAACRSEQGSDRAAARAAVRGEVTGRASDEVVLDVSAGGAAIVGRVAPPLERSDVARVVAARVVGGGPSMPVAHVLDARFGASGSLLVLTPDHALTLYEAGRAKGIDRDVYGPLALSADRRRVAYTRGAAPLLELIVADLVTGAVERAAPGMVPAWCPAWAADDVVFVAAHEGQASLYRRRAGQRIEPIALGPGEPFPTGPSAPVVVGATMVFEDESGLHARSLRDGARSDLPGLGLPVVWPGAGVVAQRRHGADNELVPVVLGAEGP